MGVERRRFADEVPVLGQRVLVEQAVDSPQSLSSIVEHTLDLRKVGGRPHGSDHLRESRVRSVENSRAQEKGLGKRVRHVGRRSPSPLSGLPQVSEDPLPSRRVGVGPADGLQGSNGVDLDVEPRCVAAPGLGNCVVEATTQPLRSQDVGPEPVASSAGVSSLGQRCEELVFAYEDELDLASLLSGQCLPLDDLRGPAGICRRAVLRVSRWHVERHRDEVALQVLFVAQYGANRRCDLARRRRIELEQVLRLPCPDVPVRKNSVPLAASVGVPETSESNAFRPLDGAPLDQDRREFLESTRSRRWLAIRANLVEVDVWRCAIHGEHPSNSSAVPGCDVPCGGAKRCHGLPRTRRYSR